MKKIIAGIFSLIIFFQNSVLASSLYLIQNSSRAVISEIIQKDFSSKSYILLKTNPYYGIHKNDSMKFAIVLLEDDVSGLYYYFDGDFSLNNKILKDLSKKKIKYVEINTKLKNSFDNMAKERVFSQKTKYDFNEEPIFQTYQGEQPEIFVPETNLDKSTEDDLNLTNNVIYGYVGKLAAGTEIYAYLQNPLNTESVKKGDTIKLVVSRDLIYNGSIVAPQGSIVTGKVTKASSAGYAQRNGRIEINFDILTLPSGKVYNITTEKVDFKVEADEKTSTNVAAKVIVGAATTSLVGLMIASLGSSSNVGRAMAIGAGVGAVGAGVSEVAKRGVDAEIPAYTEINLVLTQPLNVIKN